MKTQLTSINIINTVKTIKYRTVIMVMKCVYNIDVLCITTVWCRFRKLDRRYNYVYAPFVVSTILHLINVFIVHLQTVSEFTVEKKKKNNTHP